MDLVDTVDTAEDEEKMRLREKKCKSILVQCIHDSQLEYIKDKKEAKAIFDALKAVFERKSVAGQLLLRKRLLTMKYIDGNEMSQHFLKFDRCVRELKSIGATMEEIDIVCHLLLTLPSSFDNLVTAIETIDPVNLSIDFVKSRILDEFQKRPNGVVTTESADSVAMNAGRNKPKGKCFNCGKPGHFQSECRAPKNDEKNNFSGNRNTGRANVAANSNALNGETESRYDRTSLCAISMIADAQAAHCTTRDDGNLKFVLDSGSTDYMVNDKSYFDDLKQIDPIKIAIAKDGEMLEAKQCGNISVKTVQNGESTNRTMSDVLFVKDLKCNLMSIGKLCDRDYEVTFTKHGARISKDGQVQFTANRNGSLYEVEFQVKKDAFAGVADEWSRKKQIQSLWHQRLCHLNVFDMKKLITQEMVTGIEKIKVDTDGKFCEPCVMGKQSKLPFSKRNVIRTTPVLELIHTDVYGPVSVEA